MSPMVTCHLMLIMESVKAANIVGANWRTCAGNGDYQTLQREAGMEFCADKEDGWQVSGQLSDSSANVIMIVRCPAESCRTSHCLAV